MVVRRLVDEKLVSELQLATDELEEEAAGIETSVRDRGVFFEVQSASGRKGEPAVAPGVRTLPPGVRRNGGEGLDHPSSRFLAYKIKKYLYSFCFVFCFFGVLNHMFRWNGETKQNPNLTQPKPA